MGRQEFREKINQLKETPELKVITPIHLGAGRVIFYDYEHTCEKMKEDDDLGIIRLSYSYTYSSWAGVDSIHNKRKVEDKFVLGNYTGFSYPSEGIYIEGFLFCPYCGLNLRKDFE